MTRAASFDRRARCVAEIWAWRHGIVRNTATLSVRVGSSCKTPCRAHVSESPTRARTCDDHPRRRLKLDRLYYQPDRESQIPRQGEIPRRNVYFAIDRAATTLTRRDNAPESAGKCGVASIDGTGTIWHAAWTTWRPWQAKRGPHQIEETANTADRVPCFASDQAPRR
jgi:hypothetical protein